MTQIDSDESKKVIKNFRITRTRNWRFTFLWMLFFIFASLSKFFLDISRKLSVLLRKILLAVLKF